MADFACDFSDPGVEHGANFLVTNLEDGDTAKLCSEHFPVWMAAFLGELGFQVVQPGQETAATANGEGEAAPDPPRPKRGRTRRENGEAALSAEESPFPDPTPDPG